MPRRPPRSSQATSRVLAAPPVTGLLASPLRNLLGGGLYMAVVMLCATLAYEAAGWPLGDAVYMVVLTVYTVGYDEVRPVDTTLLRAITMALIVLGCTGMIFLTGALVQLITASQIQQLFGQRRMQSQIDRLTDHIIICGFGRIGRMLARQLDDGSMPFLILERSEELLAEIRGLGYAGLHGDATDEALLATAGIERARCLATVLPDDAANVFITLSARSLNPTLTIIARGEQPSTERKLLQAGANRVVMPAHIGAERIAELLLYPEADRFLHGSQHKEDFARDLRLLGLDLEVVTVGEGSPVAGRTVGEVEEESHGGLFVVGLNRRDGAIVPRPDRGAALQVGDGAIILMRPGAASTVDALFHRRSSTGRRAVPNPDLSRH
ncbi:MAG: NAD-binding protein [Acetobacteraceae bacterium]|nr:NAD-binding protein [Acetobacteraceae bacterium]